MGSRKIVAALLALLVTIVPLLTALGPALLSLLGSAFWAAITLDGVAILLTLSYASWHKIWWESFLHPRSYRAGVASAVGQAVIAGLAGVVASVGAIILVLLHMYPASIALVDAWLLLHVYAGVSIARALILACLWWRSVSAR